MAELKPGDFEDTEKEQLIPQVPSAALAEETFTHIHWKTGHQV